MTPFTLALALVWIGALLLAAVVVQRARSGAWSEQALDATPPVSRWLWPAIALGLALVAAGTALLVWSLA